MNKKGAAGNLFVGHNILITNCAILFCGYCTAGASDSYSVIATYPLLFRYGGIFGCNNRYGDSSSEFATRVGVVCGAGLLYRPEKQKCSTIFCIFVSMLFLGTVQCPCPTTV